MVAQSSWCLIFFPETIMVWTGAHRVFAVETFLKTGKSVIAEQRAFRAHFMLRRNDAVPERIFERYQYL